jgi:hypothetical protein
MRLDGCRLDLYFSLYFYERVLYGVSIDCTVKENTSIRGRTPVVCAAKNKGRKRPARRCDGAVGDLRPLTTYHSLSLTQPGRHESSDRSQLLALIRLSFHTTTGDRHTHTQTHRQTDKTDRQKCRRTRARAAKTSNAGRTKSSKRRASWSTRRTGRSASLRCVVCFEWEVVRIWGSMQGGHALPLRFGSSSSMVLSRRRSEELAPRNDPRLCRCCWCCCCVVLPLLLLLCRCCHFCRPRGFVAICLACAADAAG